MVPQELIQIGSKVTMTCRASSTYTLTRCKFYIYNMAVAEIYANSTTESGMQYVIEHAALQHEGEYYCICNAEEDRHSLFPTNPNIRLVLKGHLEKPKIQVIFNRTSEIRNMLTIECSSSSNYTLTYCWFCKDDHIMGYSSLLSLDLAVQYELNYVGSYNEGLYYCVCHTAENKRTRTSFHAPLIINSQVEKPHMDVDEVQNAIICASINNAYNYKFCILYKNGQHIMDTALSYYKTPNNSVTFFVSDLPAGNNFSCLCYTAEKSRWTNYSYVTIEGEAEYYYHDYETEYYLEYGYKYKHKYNYITINIVRLGFGFIVLLILVIFIVVSRCR
ncbi:uncharacterized protein LOC122815350 [Protopterus annectens]|uniref:uncharacterized protein LOC122815350 n=1 Tax=Protopterus annectens TaxID=7888 RepID=UPI001CFA6E30|nr:uncharacterized protein LOC122815350 [Protopterus annectens]